MNITDRFEKLLFYKTRNTCLKMTLFFGALGALLGGLIIGPLCHEPSAFEVEFTKEDMTQFKEQETKNIERGLEYFSSEFDLWKGKTHLNEQIENGTCIPSYFRNETDFRRYNRFKKDVKGERKGKISAQYRGKSLSAAINRAIDECSWHDFHGGYLMKNSALESTGIYIYGAKNPNGYSIVTAGWEKFHDCMYRGIVLGIIGLLLPLVFYLGTSILYFVVCGPVIGIYRASSRWVKWTFSEFFK